MKNNPPMLNCRNKPMNSGSARNTPVAGSEKCGINSEKHIAFS
jgi:hypothetical protein